MSNHVCSYECQGGSAGHFGAELASLRERNEALEAKCALLAASLKKADEERDELKADVERQGDALDWSAIEIGRLGGNQVPGDRRPILELRTKLATIERETLERVALYVADEWDHEIRVRGLPDAIRALATKEET
jgi:hypothetical protein